MILQVIMVVAFPNNVVDGMLPVPLQLVCKPLFHIIYLTIFSYYATYVVGYLLFIYLCFAAYLLYCDGIFRLSQMVISSP